VARSNYIYYFWRQGGSHREDDFAFAWTVKHEALAWARDHLSPQSWVMCRMRAESPVFSFLHAPHASNLIDETW
jgi:hypothetical protein